MIELKNIYKQYGNYPVLKGLDLQVADNEITALVGKNGAGKTTLIRIIAGILRQDSGTVNIGNDGTVGILLGGDVNLYSNLSVYENINFFGQLHGLTKPQINNRIEELDSALHVTDFLEKRGKDLSRGMKQKTALLISTIADPDVLLLDEPSTGLDLEACSNVISFLKHQKSRSKTILMATHNLFEISDLSDSIAIMKDGVISKKVVTHEFFKFIDNEEKGKRIVEEMTD